MPDSFKIALSDTESVTGVLYRAATRKRVSATLLLGHGAGSGQTSGFMVEFAMASLIGESIRPRSTFFIQSGDGEPLIERINSKPAITQQFEPSVRLRV